MKRDERGISPVIGSILLVAIVIMLVAVLAAFTSRASDLISGPSATLSVEAAKKDSENISITIIHKGGEALLKKDLIVYAENKDNKLVEITDNLTWPEPFTAGTEATGAYYHGSVLVGMSVTVRVVHGPSSQLLFDGIVYVKKR